ncbi:sulfur reduction protein DsrJ [Marichromatium bheemlicum]|uniref:Sulfur reduction protein DsrJ n=1 Tax=Marichromatium bheemlicum TaxID=365339 RepID=A0ABX1IAA5_9GAMM|nr:sulfur reduction protein DsrJ [Marichromatium bheemlicum]NKN34462.1 sulfur reduction protein DsrJ [Marichromatium bheemlicum]
MVTAVSTTRTHAVALLWILAVLTAMPASARSTVVPGSEAAGLGACVEPTELMRRQHMEFIKHQRDRTVHGGIRTSKHSLAGCVECHIGHDAQGQAVPIDRADQFCGACHAYVAVDLNCFDCHAAVPRGPMAGSLAEAARRAVDEAQHGQGAVQP